MKRDLEKVMRKKGWSANRSTLVAFLESLDSGRKVEADADDAPATPVQPEPPSEPPPPTPPVGPSLETSPGSPPADKPEILLAADDDLEEVLSPPTSKSRKPGIDDSGFRIKSGAAGGTKKRLWMALGALAVILAAAGGWFFFGRKGPESTQSARAVPITILATETPTPQPTAGLMSDQELIEEAREVAAAEIIKQEEELRKRLEEDGDADPTDTDPLGPRGGHCRSGPGRQSTGDDLPGIAEVPTGGGEDGRFRGGGGRSACRNQWRGGGGSNNQG
jgi:hypothetical protein